MILGDARRGVADKGHPPRVEVGEPAEPVVDRPGIGIGVERIDREIAARGIVAPVVGEGDRRAAAVGFDIAAQRRNLVMIAAGDRGDGAMRDARRSEEHTSELQSLMRISYAVFCLKKKKKHYKTHD